MRVDDIELRATDGYSLGATLYRPSGPDDSGLFLLIASAVGAKRGFYSKFAKYFCSQRFHVLCFDYRGIGDSRPKSLVRFQANLREWGERDLVGVIDWIATEYGSHLLMAIGHSVGSQVIGLAHNNHRVRAMVAIAAPSGYWGHWPFPRKYALAALWYLVVPAIASTFTYFPARRLNLGEDLPGGVALEWARWCRHRNYIVDGAGNTIRQYFDAFKAPILFYSFADDPYAPRSAVEHMMNCYTNAEKSWRHIDPHEIGVKAIGHFGFFREQMKSALWAETADWLRQTQ